MALNFAEMGIAPFEFVERFVRNLVDWLLVKLASRNLAWALFTTIGGRRKYKLWKSFDAYMYDTWIGPAMEY